MIIIKNGRILDPASGTDRVGDLFIQGSKLVAGPDDKNPKNVVIDAKGLLVVPGLIDMHVHTREPGFEYKETIATACEAAANGGFTSIVAMPNTEPVCDTAAVVSAVYERAARANGVSVFPMGAITKKLAGEELAEYGDLVKAGIVAISDDGKGVMNAAIMRAAFEYALNFDLTICAHCEDRSLATGFMHEGEMSSHLGLRAIPAAAESVIVARDLHLLEHTGSRYHVQHISTKAAIDMVRQAKKNGLRVTCEVAPHHFTLSDEAVAGYDSVFKVNPPLRSQEHIKAIRKALKDGTIDAIATDHAPHAEIDKKVEFDQAANGMIGLETALPLSLSLVREGLLELSDLIAKFTINPARILKLTQKGSLATGLDADVTIIDPERRWVYDAAQVRSKSRNSPWLGKEMVGRAVVTIARGKIVHQL